MKFRISQDCVAFGHLRYGHLEGVIEASSEEDAIAKVKSGEARDFLEFVLDDYELDEYDECGEPEIELVEDDGAS